MRSLEKSTLVSLDLRDDADDLRAMLEKAVRRYASRHRSGRTAALHPPVTRVDLAFSLGDGGSTPWVYLYFDTKPGSEPDGDPTHPNFARLLRKNWRPAVVEVFEGRKVEITRINGKTRKCDEAKLTEEIGKFLVSLLLAAKADGVFAALPRDKRCELGVEDPTTGAFGWPIYEDRGRKNLV